MALTFLTAVILGIVEGLTEFAPVSSTAHILITGKVIGIAAPSFFIVFTVVVQSCAILATIIFFWKTIWNNLALIPKIIVGFIPTAIVGLLLQRFIMEIFSYTWIIGAALVAGGIVFLFLKPVDTVSEIKNISYKEAFLIGCTQILAFIPGVSRSGATLIGGTALGISRSQIVVFSFLLGVPTILGASALEIHSVTGLSSLQWSLIAVGGVTAFVTALLTMKWFINLLTKKPLSWFGWYRIIVGVVILLFIQ